MEEAHCSLEEQQSDTSSLWSWHPLGNSNEVLRHHLHCQNFCFLTLQKTFSQPAQSRGCTKQLQCYFLVFTKVSPQSVSASPRGNTLSHLAYRTLVKDLLFFLRMRFQIVFCFCHISFSYPNQYSQSACRFYMP